MKQKELNTRLNSILFMICSDENDSCEHLKRDLYDELSRLKIELTGFDGFKEHALSRHARLN